MGSSVKKQKLCKICGKPMLQKKVSFGGSEMILDIPQCDCMEKEAKRLEKIENENKKKENFNKMLRFSEIPEKHKEMLQNKVYNKNYVDDIFQNFELSKYKSVYLYGPVGTGKSFTTSYFLFKLLKEGKKVKYKKAIKMVLELSAIEPKDYKRYADGLIGVDVLVIDDIDKLKVTESRLTTLLYLIDERNDLNRLTIYTSNKTLEELYAKFSEDKEMGQAIISRIQENGLIKKIKNEYLR